MAYLAVQEAPTALERARLEAGLATSAFRRAQLDELQHYTERVYLSRKEATRRGWEKIGEAFVIPSHATWQHASGGGAR